MTDAARALAVIRDFVDLAVRRRVAQLPPAERMEMDALEEVLRDAIDGARPKPKRIDNPEASAAPSRPSAPVPSAKVEVRSREGENLKLAGLAEKLEVSLADKNKIREVSASSLPVSHYTPPATPSFLGDYYDDVVPEAVTGDVVPGSIIRADGEAVALKKEVKVLFGLEAPAGPAGSPRPASPRPTSSRPAPTRPASSGRRASSSGPPQPGRPAIIHFVRGGTKRGRIAPFDPSSGQVVLLPKQPDQEKEAIDLGAVLAIFLGLTQDERPTEPAGDQVVITLINDKRVSGLTNDYQEGGDALTIVPEPRRGNIDRIWIPATAVKAIEMP